MKDPLTWISRYSKDVQKIISAALPWSSGLWWELSSPPFWFRLQFRPDIWMVQSHPWESSSLSLFPAFLFAIELLFSQWVYVKPIFRLTLEGHRKDLGGRWSERELSCSAPSQLGVVFIAIVILHCVGTLIVRSGWLVRGHLKPSTPFLHVPCWGIGAIFELKWKEGSDSCIKTWRTAS